MSKFAILILMLHSVFSALGIKMILRFVCDSCEIFPFLFVVLTSLNCIFLTCEITESKNVFVLSEKKNINRKIYPDKSLRVPYTKDPFLVGI